MAKFPQCPRIDWTREEKKLVFFSTTVQQLNQFKREHYSLKYFENLFKDMLNNECGIFYRYEIQAHNPYTKSYEEDLETSPKNSAPKEVPPFEVSRYHDTLISGISKSNSLNFKTAYNMIRRKYTGFLGWNTNFS